MSNDPDLKMPFPDQHGANEFKIEVIRRIAKEMDARRAKLIPVENVLLFQHGANWTYLRAEEEGFVQRSGKAEKHELPVEIEQERLRENDFSVLPELILTMGALAEKGFLDNFTSEMDEIATETGREIKVQPGHSLADAYLEAIRTTQASVSQDGVVGEMDLIMAPAMIAQLKREISERGDKFQQKVQEARKRQEEYALSREKQRLAKFDE